MNGADGGGVLIRAKTSISSPLWAALGFVLTSSLERRAAAQDPSETVVVIEGERRAIHETAREPSASTTVIPRSRLQAPGLGAAGALRAAGASTTETGGFGAYATAGLRGASAAQTPVYLGGVRLNDEVGGAADLGAIPLWFVDRVEIYRGDAPIDADELGIGGAIFFEPRKPNGSSVDLGGLVGSHGTRGLFTAASAGGPEDGVIAGVGFASAENRYSFEDDRGTLFDPTDDRISRRANADASLLDVWLNARRRISDSQLSLLAHYGRAERGVPRLALLPSRAAREDVDRALVALSTRTAFGRAGEWVDASTTALQSSTALDDPLRELGIGAGRVDLSGARIQQSLGLRMIPAQGWLLRPTLTASSERLERREAGEGASEPVLVARRFDWRPALGAEYRFGDAPLSIRALLALECTSTGRSGLGLCDEARPTGRFGPTFRARHWLAYVNVGRYARSPTLGERFGNSLLVRGNPRLVPEIGLSTDGGIRYHTSQPMTFWVDASSFARWTDNVIAYTRTAQGYVVPENRDRGRVLGFEISSGLSPFSGVNLDVAVTALEPRDISPNRTLRNNVLPLQSRLLVSPGVEATHSFERGFLSSLAARCRYVYQSNRYADRAGLALIPEQGNLEIELEAQWFDARVVSRARVENLLDTQRFDVVGFPLLGRSLFAAIEAHF